mmetsp:Transcript_33142/g.55544  ORF Transcript_33142/g.55544 Transcript_33142/m.55544 type:complete len:285 (-) Transcript_33142:1557-2411(-)
MKMPRPMGIMPYPQLVQSPLPRTKGAMVRDTIDISLIKMFNAGPEVSLNGSPTVSPTTHALPCSVFLMPSFSQSFLPLSQAPPALDMVMATMHPEVMAPVSMPTRQRGPTRKPTASGASTAYAPGASISRTEDRVEISTHLSESGSTSSSAGISRPWLALMMQSLRPGTSRNWRRTSWMISAAALPTDTMVSAANMKGSIAPKSTPERINASAMFSCSSVRPVCCLKAARSEREVSTADPMANPFPVAAVVLPRASKASVLPRTSLGMLGSISASPPALSATGP